MMKFLSDKLVKSLGLVVFAGLSVAVEGQTFKWSPAGPIYTAGRARNMLVDKTDASGNTLYVGSTTSGVFKSVDGGSNWAPLNDQGTVRNISYMAQAADNTIFVATGEAFLRPSQAAKAQPGTGLYKLTGTTFSLVLGSVPTGTAINRVACHPTSASIIALATNLGAFYSTDGGGSFTQVNTGTVTGMGQDVKFDANGVLYFSIGSIAGGLNSSAVWKSNGPLTNGSSFTDVTPVSPFLPNPNFGRIELAIAPSNPNVIYASCANKYVNPVKNSASLAGLFVSYDAGVTWGTVLIGSPQLDPLGNSGTLASGDYAHTIVVDAVNSNKLYFGGYMFYTFTRTGGSNSSPTGNWVHLGNPYALNTQLYLHENIHDIKVIGSNPAKYYFVTDAGIYRSIDIDNTSFIPSFQPFYKGLITGQFNSVSAPRYPAANTSTVTGTQITPYQTYIGGTGGNGMAYFSGNYPLVSTELNFESGDIFNAEYSKILSNAAYFSSSSGGVFRSADVTTGTSNQIDWVVNTKKQDIFSFTNNTYTLSGTPFKLWENLGRVKPTPDSLIFYNDSSQAKNSIPSLTATTQFTFSIGRPQAAALIDSIVVKTATVPVASTPSAVAIPSWSASGINTKTLSIRMSPTYTVSSTASTVVAPISSISGFSGTASSFSVILNNSTKLDQISVALAAPLWTAQPTSAPSTTNVSDYIRLVATVFYRYPPSSTVNVIDNSISTKSATFTIATPTAALSWNTRDTIKVGTTTLSVVNPVLKTPQPVSARLALPYASGLTGGSGYAYSVRVSNSPLDMNTPVSFVTVSQDKCLTDDANGNPTTNTISVLGKPTVLEWGKEGRNLYYATETATGSCLYRVSHLNTIIDSTAKGYSGKLHTNVFTYSNTPGIPPTTTATTNNPNPRCPYRTTLLGSFPNKITSISVNALANDSASSTAMVLTFDDPSPTGTLVMASTNDITKSDISNIQFTDKTSSALSGRKMYCSLLEKSNYKKAYIGTDNGIFYTSDVTLSSPTWSNVNTVNSDPNYWLPNVQVFDIKQQTLDPWESYYSGQIFVATNGRGVWTNSDYYIPTVVSVKENPKVTYENNLTMYPNPTNGNVNLLFSTVSGETATITLYDVNGRAVQVTNLGKVYAGEVTHTFETTNLSAGIYIVNVSSDSGIKRVAKLIVTK